VSPAGGDAARFRGALLGLAAGDAVGTDDTQRVRLPISTVPLRSLQIHPDPQTQEPRRSSIEHGGSSSWSNSGSPVSRASP
jgi:hypothetical protein